MPTYEYLCEANGRVVEVNHKMAERVSTWGELCERAGIAPGKTAANAPVNKLMSAGFVNTGGASSCTAELPPCQTGKPCCGGGMCTPH
jgi:predicted nucleic acid-binding Zn ribbon protein